jgi:D-beta-D-heptose 7-phosphate kinase/D-beta-D-heptose 1-phosphate adenosyltransferase
MADIVARLAGRRILVVGDVMLDQFLVGRVDRISPEAPVPVVKFIRDEYRLGGAANVANNVAALGGRVRLVGLVGTDEAARTLDFALGVAGVDGAHLVMDEGRTTTRKVRLVTPRNQQVSRVDYETDADASGAVEDRIIAQIADGSFGPDAIVLSDYRKGVVTPRVIDAAAAFARSAGVPLLVDPKVPNAERYRGASLITPNHHEAEVMAQMTIRSADDVRAAARQLGERSGASVLITWGEHGMWVLDRHGGAAVEESLPAAAREVADVTGAGDTVIAVLALGLASGASLPDAARLANAAAGVVVGHFGPAAPTPDELRAAIGGRV